MKLKASKESLLRGIQVVQNAVSSKSTLPILSHVLLEASKKEIRLSATDLEIGLSIKIEGEVVEPGSITVPARKFSEIIKELPLQKKVTVSLDKGQSISIESGSSFFRLMGLSKDDFPQLPDFSEDSSGAIQKTKLPQELLKTMIQLTAFAVSHDEARYVLNGILFSFKESTLKLVATDGRRLAVIEKKVSKSGNIKKDIIVPTKTIQELNRNLGDSGEVTFLLKENQLQINIGELIIVTRLVEGEYPNYEQVIPKKIKEELSIDTQDFLQAARRASILTHQESQSIKLNIIKNRLIITKNTPELGEVREEVPVDYKGGELAIGFNPNFLVDALKNVDAEVVKFGFIDPEKPAVIKSGDDYTYIVLPMQIS